MKRVAWRENTMEQMMRTMMKIDVLFAGAWPTHDSEQPTEVIAHCDCRLYGYICMKGCLAYA
jgi:hypothetical protein